MAWFPYRAVPVQHSDMHWNELAKKFYSPAMAPAPACYPRARKKTHRGKRGGRLLSAQVITQDVPVEQDTEHKLVECAPIGSHHNSTSRSALTGLHRLPAEILLLIVKSALSLSCGKGLVKGHKDQHATPALLMASVNRSFRTYTFESLKHMPIQFRTHSGTDPEDCAAAIRDLNGKHRTFLLEVGPVWQVNIKVLRRGYTNVLNGLCWPEENFLPHVHDEVRAQVAAKDQLICVEMGVRLWSLEPWDDIVFAALNAGWNVIIDTSTLISTFGGHVDNVKTRLERVWPKTMASISGVDHDRLTFTGSSLPPWY